MIELTQRKVKRRFPGYASCLCTFLSFKMQTCGTIKLENERDENHCERLTACRKNLEFLSLLSSPTNIKQHKNRQHRSSIKNMLRERERENLTKHNRQCMGEREKMLARKRVNETFISVCSQFSVQVDVVRHRSRLISSFYEWKNVGKAENLIAINAKSRRLPVNRVNCAIIACRNWWNYTFLWRLPREEKRVKQAGEKSMVD